MRAADAATLIRTALIIIVVYLILIRFNALVTISIFVISIVLDAVDGFLAVWQLSKGKVSFSDYLGAALFRDRKSIEKVSPYKSRISRHAKFGPRMDVAGDRFAEYSMWIVFSFVGIVPLALLIAVVLRHSFADAIMAARGTSSKMKSGFARVIYTSNASRAAINVVKILTFSYMILVYVSGFPVIAGYVLVGILFAFVMLRGAAEIYEGTRG